MVKIAMIISGRIARYDVCLLKTLLDTPYHDIDLFISINDENSEAIYYDIMKLKLQPYLKDYKIHKYNVPIDIFDLIKDKPDIRSHTIEINNFFIPYNQLSMFYNDNIAFKLAYEYADKNKFEYDIYMKYRSDIGNITIPKIIPLQNNDIHLHNVIPKCNFISGGLYKKAIVSDAIAWGNRKTMNIYFNTYNYAIEKLKLTNGNYYIAFECTLTDNIYENKLEHSYYKINYNLDRNRRMFDNNNKSKPININNVKLRNITDNSSMEKIPFFQQ